MRREEVKAIREYSASRRKEVSSEVNHELGRGVSGYEICLRLGLGRKLTLGLAPHAFFYKNPIITVLKKTR